MNFAKNKFLVLLQFRFSKGGIFLFILCSKALSEKYYICPYGDESSLQYGS